MPATSRKTIDKTIERCKKYFAILDDILIASKGKKGGSEDALDITVHTLDKEGLAISL